MLVAAVMLFTSRRRDGSRLRRWSWRGARGAFGLALAVMIASPVGMAFMAANRSDPPPGELDLGRPHEDVTLHTSDGLALGGSYVPSTNGAAVIVFPGRSGSQTPGRARMLVAHGYGVLVFDPRGHGASEGDPNVFGWSGEEDVRSAIRFLQARPDVDPARIGGLGLSVGGELMLQTAARDEGLRAVVSEGAGSRSIAEDVRMPAPDVFIGLPFSVVTTVATAVFSESLPPPALHRLVPEIAPRPIMLIWSRRGNGEKYFDPAYYDRAGEPKENGEIPESTHIDGLATRPVEYERRVVGFFDRALR
jgi:pimeloyl-ACP methyl ester carboxylesterase